MPWLGFLASNRYEIDLSNEVLNINFWEVAAKIFEVQVEDHKTIADLAGFETDAPMPVAKLVDVFLTSIFDL